MGLFGSSSDEEDDGPLFGAPSSAAPKAPAKPLFGDDDDDGASDDDGLFAAPAAAPLAPTAKPPRPAAPSRVIKGLFDDDEPEPEPEPALAKGAAGPAAGAPLDDEGGGLFGGESLAPAPPTAAAAPAPPPPAARPKQAADSLFDDDDDDDAAAPAPKQTEVVLEDWLAEAPDAGLAAAAPPPPKAKAARSLELELELIELQLAMERPESALKERTQPSAASSPPAEPPAPAAPGSRRAAKRAARKRDKQTGVSKLWGARLASDQSRHRRPAVPKLPPDTGGALHDSLIKRQWAAAESHLAAQPASASAVASGTAESGALRCCGRGADLLPLHLALLYGAPKGLVSDLLAVYPRAARQIVSVSGSGVRGRRLLPLHIAMLASSDAAVVNLLIASNPAAAVHTCSGFRGYTELLPLHLAILCGAPAAVTRQVLTANRAALRDGCVKPGRSQRARTFGGRIPPADTAADIRFLPIHLAAMVAAEPDVLRLLLAAWPDSVSERLAHASTGTRYGNAQLVDVQPLHLAIAVGSRLAPTRVTATVRQLLTASPGAARQTCDADIVVGKRLTVHVRQRAQESPWIVGKLLPIHLALVHRSPSDLVELLLRTSNAGAHTPIEPRYTRADCDETFSSVELFNRTRMTFVLGTGPIHDHMPLHLALLNAASLASIQDILTRAPETAKLPCRPFYDPGCEGASGCLPLHLAVFKKADPDIVQAVIDAHVDAAGSCLDVGIRNLANVLPIHIALMVGSPLATLHALLTAYPQGAEAACFLRKWEHRVTPQAIAHDNVASFKVPDKTELYLWRPSHGRSFDHEAGRDAVRMFDCFELHPDSDVAAVVRTLSFFGLKDLVHGGADVVRVIQTYALRWVYRFWYKRLRACSIMLVAKARRTKCQNDYARLLRVSIASQAARRRIVALRAYKSLLSGAIRAQSLRRGILARREREAMLAAMAKMQRILRGRVQRRRYVDVRDGSRSLRLAATLVMQSMRRARDVHQRFIDQKRACITLQCGRRRAVAIHRTRVKRTVQRGIEHHFAIVVQSYVRVLLAQRLLARMRRDSAATKLQTRARTRWASRNLVGLKMVDRVFRNYSSIVIQKFARRWFAARHVKRVRAAIHIQTCRRRMVARRRRSALALIESVFNRTVFGHAAATIQSRRRGIKGRRHAAQKLEEHNIWKERNDAAKCIQSRFQQSTAGRRVTAARVVNAAWSKALNTHSAVTIQTSVRALLARRRLSEAIAAKNYHQTTMRGSSLKELIEAIRDELGLDASTKPRDVIKEARAFLGMSADDGANLSMLEQAQQIATELGVEVKTMRAGPAVRAELQRLQAELERAQSQLDALPPPLEVEVETANVEEPLPDMLLWESDEAHIGWWRVDEKEPWKFADDVDARAHWTGTDYYGRKVPYNGWRPQAHPEDIRELMAQLPKLRLSEFGTILRDSALHLQGREMDIDAINLSALLMDLDVPRPRHKDFLRGFQFLLSKAGREDTTAERLLPACAPHGFKDVHITAVYQTIEWASAERARIMQTLSAQREAEEAWQAAEKARLERLESQRKAWVRTQSALAALKSSSQDVILEEALKRLYFGMDSRPQAMAALSKFDTEGLGKMSEAQFIAAFDALHLQLSAQQSSLVMAVVHADHDELISIEEFCDLVYVVKLDRVQRRFEQARQRQSLWTRQREAAEEAQALRREQLAAHKSNLQAQIEQGLVDPVAIAAAAVKAAQEDTTAVKQVPPELEPMVAALPALDRPLMVYVLQVAALRLQGRDKLVDADDFLAAIHVCGARQPFLKSCEWLVTKAARPDAKLSLLQELLTPLGFSSEHLEALFETIDWVREGAAEVPVAPARKAQEAASAERAAAKAAADFEERVAAEVAKRIAAENLVASAPEPAPAASAAEASADGDGEAEAPAEGEEEQEEEAPPEPAPPELEALVAQLPLCNKEVVGRAMAASALDLLGRGAEVDVETVVGLLASAGVPAAEHSALLESCTALLLLAGEDGALDSLIDSLGRMGFSRDHCEAVSETVAWVGDGAAIFDVPSFEPTPEPLEPDDAPAKPAGAPAAAEDSSGLDEVEEEDEGEELERMAPPPVLEAVVYAAAWLDTEAWAVLIESAAFGFVGCEDMINKPRLRSSLTECGIEATEHDKVLKSCRALIKGLSKHSRNPSAMAGQTKKLRAMGLKPAYVKTASTAVADAQAASKEAKAKAKEAEEMEKKNKAAKGLVSDLFGNDDELWLPGVAAAPAPAPAPAKSQPKKAVASSSMFDDDDSDDDIFAVSAPKAKGKGKGRDASPHDFARAAQQSVFFDDDDD